MKRIIEKYICDCCGKEFDPYTNDSYKNEDPYAKKSFNKTSLLL